jgi:cytochrome P450
MLPVANHDPRTFPYPDTLIADRSPNKHLGFGTGVHRCLGAYILRVEARIVIEEFLARIPEFELDRSGMAPWARGQVADMGTVPIVFEHGEPLHNEPINKGVQAWLEHAKANGSKFA